MPGTSRRPPATSTTSSRCAPRCDGGFDLRDLEPVAAQRLARTEVTATGLTCFDTDRDFTARLHSTLGIGAAGDGDKAVALLGRIQAGQQITTVDALYKTMVLEEPETLATADAVVAAVRRALRHPDQDDHRPPAGEGADPDPRTPRAPSSDAVERLRVIDEIGSFADDVVPRRAVAHGRRLDLLRARRGTTCSGTAGEAELSETRRPGHRGREPSGRGAGRPLRASGGDRLDTAHARDQGRGRSGWRERRTLTRPAGPGARRVGRRRVGPEGRSPHWPRRRSVRPWPTSDARRPPATRSPRRCRRGTTTVS